MVTGRRGQAQSMRHPMLLAVLFLIATLSMDAAASERGYTSDELVAGFLASSDFGVYRGICIGDAADCVSRQSAEDFVVMISFGQDSAELTPAAKSYLDQVAAALLDPRLTTAKFEITGYTDASGSAAHNQELSVRRAASALSYLESKGVPVDRMLVTGQGEANPPMPDPNDPGNRRVEFRIFVDR